MIVLSSPAPCIEVLSGSNVDFTWTLRVFEPKLTKAISWNYLSPAGSNGNNDLKLIHKNLKGNNSIGRSPVVQEDKRKRTNCTFDFLNLIWTLKCRLINAKAYDSAPYRLKVEFYDSTLLPYMTNNSFLKVFGKFPNDGKYSY